MHRINQLPSMMLTQHVLNYIGLNTDPVFPIRARRTVPSKCVPCTNMMKKTSALKQLLETSEVTCIAWAWDQILAVVAIFWRRQNKMQKGLFIMHLVHVKETQVAKIDPECPTKAYLINIS